MNVLRELRGGLHGAAMIGHGLDPHLAVSIGGPVMLGLYGYDGPHPDTEDPGANALWAAAAEAGEVALGEAAFAVLDEAERDELVELLDRPVRPVHRARTGGGTAPVRRSGARSRAAWTGSRPKGRTASAGQVTPLST